MFVSEDADEKVEKNRLKVMEEILKRLQTLTPDQLRQQFTAAGLRCGPVTATTRSIFEKKLARALLQNQTEGSDSAEELHQPINEQNKQEMSHEAPTTESPEVCSEDPSVYYGVCPQPDDPAVRDDAVLVYVDKTKALKAVMKLKGARFKAFSSRELAENFSRGSCEGGVSPHKPSPERSRAGCITECSVSLDSVNLEKANEFRSPRTQDLTAKLRKAVETGDQESFTELVWDNPRYLIGSGDNPTIVQEGCRYNVLHVAAKENQPEMTRLILETLQNPKFMRLMYPDDEELMLCQRIRYIVDLYLNTPDKASNETPLHFACKFGCPDVVNVLCSHPYIDKNCRNKYGQKPSSVICERKNKSKEVKQKIMEYLEDRFYVPLLRATDNTLHPVIGGPWCPGSSELLDQFQGPVMTESPKNPVMAIKAFVGPLSSSKAEEFHRLWKTPPRDRSEYFHHILKSDWDQGAERVGRELAHECGHPWAEYWEFLNCFIDLSTKDGLKMLEEYLSGETFTENSLIDAGSPSSATESERTSSLICRTFQKDHPSSSGSTQQNLSEDDDPGPCRRFPVCDLMQEFEKVSFQSSLLSAGEGHPDLDLTNGESWVRSQTEEDELSCSSEDYFTADDEADHLEHFRSSDGRCSPALAHSTPSSRNHVDLKTSSSSTSSSFKSTHSSSDLLLHTQDTFILGNSPTKLDNEVLLALNNVDIDHDSCPNILKWKNKILSYPTSQRESWAAVSRMTRDTQSSVDGRTSWLTVSPKFRSQSHFNPEQFMFSPSRSCSSEAFNRSVHKLQL